MKIAVDFRNKYLSGALCLTCANTMRQSSILANYVALSLRSRLREDVAKNPC